MADIKKELNDIKNAVYGKEVRGSIHDGIKKINDEVEDATDLSESAKHQVENIQQQVNQLVVEGDSSVEAAQARVDAEGKSYPTLKARLDEKETQFSSQLAQTDTFRGNESMINRKRRVPMITWVDDDGREGFYNWMRDVALEYSIPLTSALITGRIDEPNFLKTWQIKQMLEEGFEFISHTHTNDLNNRPEDMTEEERYNDFKTSQQVLKELGANYRAIAYPYGTYTPEVVDTARRVFDYAIGTATRGDHTNIPPFDNYELMRTSTEYRSLELIKVQIDRAVEHNGWLILASHADGNYGLTETKMRQIIEYALSKGVKFVTSEEGYKAHGNIAQLTASDGIDADGEPFGTKLGRTIIDHSTQIKGDTPLSYFKRNTITYSKIGANRGGFPFDYSGFLETHNFDNDLWAYQKFTTTRDKYIFYRTWNEEENRWNDFENYSANVYLGVNAIKLDDKPQFPPLRRRVVYSYINSAGSAGFPENKSGMLIHYGFTTDGFARQEYHIYQDSKIYVRWWDGSKWSEFTPISHTRLLPINSITEETPVTDFDVGETITYVSVGNNFLGGKAGVVTTKVLSHNEPRYSEQEFKENGEFNKYIRHGQNDGSWGPWMKYVFEPV